MKTLAQPSSRPLRDFLVRFVRPDATVPEGAAAQRTTAAGLGLSDRASEWDFLGVGTFSWRHRRLAFRLPQCGCQFRSSLSSAGCQRVVSGFSAGALREDPTVTFSSVKGD